MKFQDTCHWNTNVKPEETNQVSKLSPWWLILSFMIHPLNWVRNELLNFLCVIHMTKYAPCISWRIAILCQMLGAEGHVFTFLLLNKQAKKKEKKIIIFRIEAVSFQMRHWSVNGSWSTVIYYCMLTFTSPRPPSIQKTINRMALFGIGSHPCEIIKRHKALEISQELTIFFFTIELIWPFLSCDVFQSKKPFHFAWNQCP